MIHPAWIIRSTKLGELNKERNSRRVTCQGGSGLVFIWLLCHWRSELTGDCSGLEAAHFREGDVEAAGDGGGLDEAVPSPSPSGRGGNVDLVTPVAEGPEGAGECSLSFLHDLVIPNAQR